MKRFLTLLLTFAAVLAIGACAPDSGVTTPAASATGRSMDATTAILDQAVSFPNTQDSTITGRLYVPAGAGPFKAVVAMHGCSGLLFGTKIRSEFAWWGRTLADSGYVVLFVDSFSPRSIDTVCGDGSKINEAVARVHDAYGALAFLRARSDVIADDVSILGWSNGASATLSAVAALNNPVPLPAAGGFRRAVAFYPGCGLRNQYGNTTTGNWTPYAPTRVLMGTLDAFDAECGKRVTQGQALGATDLTYTRYTGAQHGFDRAGASGTTWQAEDHTAKSAGRLLTFAFLK